MSLHQIIYTSCMRGINGINDGQQVFSYNASFKDADNDEIKSLFFYQPPALEPGVVMTEEIASTMPKSFTYKRLSSSSWALTLNTYLGRDYMGSTGRFGNYLSHVIVGDLKEINSYPCEFYNSRLLRDHMEYQEVNNPDKPDYLPEPVLEKGYSVDINSVMDFLSLKGRMEVFKNMLYATLLFTKERKRVVICDEPENIVMWIAAIHYALPLNIALNINFSTYVFDPSLSSSQICGVVPKGTRYSVEDSNAHFVFDFYHNKYEEFKKDEYYFDFIDTSMSLSYESLEDFHQFLINGYSYDLADESICGAYRLYSILSDGIIGLTEGEIDSALKFASKYATSIEKLRIFNSLINNKDELVNLNTQSFLNIADYLVSNLEASDESYYQDIRTLSVNKVLDVFLDTSTEENAFQIFYNQLDTICKKAGFNISAELINNDSSKALFAATDHEVPGWKTSFVIKLISTYINEENIKIKDLPTDSPLIQAYRSMLEVVYSQSRKNGILLATTILDEFKNDVYNLVYMAFNIESIILSISNDEDGVKRIWEYFYKTIIDHHQGDLNLAYSILYENKRYEQLYSLYLLSMASARDLLETQRMFEYYYQNFLLTDKEYFSLYGNQVLEDYYNRIKEYDERSAYRQKIELFDILFGLKIDVPFVEALVSDVVRPIPYQSMTEDSTRLVQDSFEYLYNTLQKPIKGKLMLLVAGSVLEGCKDISQLRDKYTMFEQLSQSSKADFGGLSEKSAKKYFNWFLPKVCTLLETTDDVQRLHSIFIMSDKMESSFFSSCGEIYLKQFKEDMDYQSLCQYLVFVLKEGNLESQEKVGKILSEVSKQKLNRIDEIIMTNYQSDEEAINDWKHMKSVAESTNQVINSFFKLFNRK